MDKKENARLGEYKAIADKINGKTVKIIAKAGSSGKLFGSVDAAQIAAAMADQLGVTVERKKVVVEPLKEIGTHVASVVLHKEVVAELTVEVVAESAVAEQAAAVVAEPAAIVEPVAVEAEATEEVAA